LYNLAESIVVVRLSKFGSWVRNRFSPEWYRTFLDLIPSEQTEIELAFVERHLPLVTYPFVLDLCCGPGRHAASLVRRGYRVLGVDSNRNAVARARADAPQGATFEVLDMRQLDSIHGRFDAVVNLWHSFGYFDDATNEEILRQVYAKLRSGGRAILDVYNREHLVSLPSAEWGERGGTRFEAQRTWSGSRLTVTLRYASGGSDEFEWRIYAPAELSEICSSAGFLPILSCALFDDSLEPSADYARMQFVLERR